MDKAHPLPSNKKSKKENKKRKRSSKKSPSCDGDDTSKSPSSNISKTNVQKAEGKSPNKTTNDNANTTKAKSGQYPYPTDYNDHFETPARAYDDIFPLLEYVLTKQQTQRNKKKNNTKQTKNNKGKSNETTIYDPYYCAGRAAILIDDVFQRHESKKITSTIRIQHEKRDFYQDDRNDTVPKHDILITNPPYSADHKERCLEFAVKQLKKYERPFFLLMPNYIAMKEYFRKIVLDEKIQIFYITPSSSHPYEYEHPEGTGHQTSPFASVWFCGLSCKDGKTDVKPVTDAFAKFHSTQAQSTTVGTPQIVTNLQNLIRIGGVSAEKRRNPRQRRKMREQAMQRDAAKGGGGSVGASNGGQQSKNKKRKSVNQGNA